MTSVMAGVPPIVLYARWTGSARTLKALANVGGSTVSETIWY